MFSNLDYRTARGPSDIAAVQALYGPRSDDPVNGAGPSDTFATAAPMPEPVGYDGTTPLLIYANIPSPGGENFYSLKPPTGYSGPSTIRLQTAGVSLLAPHLTVFDASGRVVGDVSSDVVTGDTLQTLALCPSG